MEKQMELLLEKMESINTNMNDMKEDFRRQMNAQTEKITNDLASTIDKKLKPILEENKVLKNEVVTLKNKVRSLEKETRKNNIILHGIKESEGNSYDLQVLVIDTFNAVSKTANLDPFDKWELSDAYRLGKKQDNKQRPILVKLTLSWRRLEILKLSKQFPTGIYVTEDYPKDVLKTREDLKIKLKEELKKGNKAVIRYDQLIIKGKADSNVTKEKRKRSPSKTPTHPTTNEEIPQKAPSKINKTNAFEFMNRPRTMSQSSTSTQ